MSGVVQGSLGVFSGVTCSIPGAVEVQTALTMPATDSAVLFNTGNALLFFFFDLLGTLIVHGASLNFDNGFNGSVTANTLDLDASANLAVSRDIVVTNIVGPTTGIHCVNST
jgi:hypothetical protein